MQQWTHEAKTRHWTNQHLLSLSLLGKFAQPPKLSEEGRRNNSQIITQHCNYRSEPSSKQASDFKSGQPLDPFFSILLKFVTSPKLHDFLPAAYLTASAIFAKFTNSCLRPIHEHPAILSKRLIWRQPTPKASVDPTSSYILSLPTSQQPRFRCCENFISPFSMAPGDHMSPWIPMQPSTDLHTGYDYEAEIEAIGQQAQESSQYDYGVPDRGYPATEFQQTEQQRPEPQSPLETVEGLSFRLRLNPQESARLHAIISTATPFLLSSILHLSLCNEQTFDHVKVLSHSGGPLAAVFHLAPGLEVVQEACWASLSSIGPGRRQTLALLLQECSALRHPRGLCVGKAAYVADPRRNSLSQRLSPTSPGCSSTTPSSAGSNGRLPPHHRCFCPDEDCSHKPGGYSKWGYLVNHVTRRHPSILADSDWEDNVETRGPGEDPPKGRRSDHRRTRAPKRPATPTTPGERVHKAGTMVLGMEATIPPGAHSPSNLNIDLGDPSPSAQRARSISTPSAPFGPVIRLNGVDVDPFTFQNAANLHPPTIMTSRVPFHNPITHVQSAPQISQHFNDELFGEITQSALPRHYAPDAQFSPYSNYQPPPRPDYQSAPHSGHQPPPHPDHPPPPPPR